MQFLFVMKMFQLWPKKLQGIESADLSLGELLTKFVTGKMLLRSG